LTIKQSNQILSAFDRYEAKLVKVECLLIIFV